MKIQTNPHTLNMIDPERDLAFRPDAASNSWFVIGHVQTYVHPLTNTPKLNLLAKAHRGHQGVEAGYPARDNS